MKYALVITLIMSLGLSAKAQLVARNDLPSPEPRSTVTPSAIPGTIEHASYSVILVQNKNNTAFEVISPRATKADVKLVTPDGNDVCTIHKGAIHIGRNRFSLAKSRKLGKGIYYAISKLSNGEQFADRIVVEK
ncbi:MAG: hypothetical protein JSS75_00025 [Bacteroidetes bacterium]|nr:hypothetical protein [Bacteroidota bacterium]